MHWNNNRNYLIIIIIQFYSWISTLISAPTRGSWTEGQDCPRDQLEGPSRRCSHSLQAVLYEIQTNDQLISDDLKLNKTCREWDRTNACYQQLMLRCSQDPVAIRNLRTHIGRYVIYSVPCSRRNSIMPNHSLGECIISEITITHTCTDAIETYLKHFITNRNYRDACRVVSSVLRCLLDVRGMIERRCGVEGGLEYTRHFIKPVIDQTRDVVIGHCSFTSPFSDYFLAPLLTSGSSSSNRPGLCLLLFLLLLLLLSLLSFVSWIGASSPFPPRSTNRAFKLLAHVGKGLIVPLVNPRWPVRPVDVCTRGLRSCLLQLRIFPPSLEGPALQPRGPTRRFVPQASISPVGNCSSDLPRIAHSSPDSSTGSRSKRDVPHLPDVFSSQGQGRSSTTSSLQRVKIESKICLKYQPLQSLRRRDDHSILSCPWSSSSLSSSSSHSNDIFQYSRFYTCGSHSSSVSSDPGGDQMESPFRSAQSKGVADKRTIE